MSPRDDRDIRAALSADRPQRTDAELEAAARRLLAGAVFRPQGSSAAWYEGRGWVAISYPCGWVWSSAGEMWTDFPTPFDAVADLLRHHPGLWPDGPEPEPKPEPLREAAQESLDLLTSLGHKRDHTGDCWECDNPWPCEVEEARRRLAAALDDR